MTDDIKKLIAEARTPRGAFAKTNLVPALADALEETAVDLDYMVINAAGLHRTAEALVAERDALCTAVQAGYKHVRGVLERLDSYSWHAHDSGFVIDTRTSALSAFEALSSAIDTKEK